MTKFPAKKETVTILIPTYNAGQNLNKLIMSLSNQTITPTEILIIDSESRDKTLDIAKSHNCKVITVSRTSFNHGTTRNLGVSETDSEFIIFLTQDVIPADEQMIAELIKPMQTNQNIALCYGRQIPRPNAGPLECFARAFNYPPQSLLKTKDDINTLGIRTFFCSNCCSAIRRSIFDKLGGFKNNVIVNEDMLFAAKAINTGYSVYYNAEAKVYHSHNYSLPEKTKRYFNIGRFFAENRWILNCAELKSYSRNMLKTGVKTFWQKREPHYIAAFIMELTLKAIAYKLGWYYQLLSHRKQNKPSD